MAILTIIDVECVKKQDTVGHDTIYVQVDGNYLAGPLSLGKRDVVGLSNATYNFTGSANIELIEVDGKVGGSNDENLGSVTVRAAQAGPAILSGDFNRLNGADYLIRYKITA